MTLANTLVILSDEHQARALGCAGHPFVSTPNLDRLAARGTMFTNAVTPSPTASRPGPPWRLVSTFTAAATGTIPLATTAASAAGVTRCRRPEFRSNSSGSFTIRRESSDRVPRQAYPDASAPGRRHGLGLHPRSASRAPSDAKRMLASTSARANSTIPGTIRPSPISRFPG